MDIPILFVIFPLPCCFLSISYPFLPDVSYYVAFPVHVAEFESYHEVSKKNIEHNNNNGSLSISVEEQSGDMHPS